MTHPFPKVVAGSHVVVCVEGLTGIVLALSGQRALGDEERYRVFVDRHRAGEWAREAVASNPLWECILYDEAGKSIEVIKNMDALLAAARGGAPKNWWRRLRSLFGGATQ